MSEMNVGVEMNGVFSRKGWDQQDTAVLTFYKVLFLRDFGVFKAGEQYKDVSLDYRMNILSVAGDDGLVLKEQRFGYVAVPNE